MLARASFLWRGGQVRPGDPIDVTGVDESRVASMRRLRLITQDPEDVPMFRKVEAPDLNGLKVDELRAIADERGVEHKGLTKPELRALLAENEDN